MKKFAFFITAGILSQYLFAVPEFKAAPPIKPDSKISFNKNFLYYTSLINTSDLGFDWIFDTKNPDSLEIEILYRYDKGPLSKRLIELKKNYGVSNIIAIDGVSTAKMSREQAINLLKGNAGSTCTLVFNHFAKPVYGAVIGANSIYNYETIQVTREAQPNLEKKLLHDKGMEELKDGNIEQAIYFFKPNATVGWGYYDESLLMMLKLFSGDILNDLDFSGKDGAIIKKKFQSYSNIDSLKKYNMYTLFGRGYPRITALLSKYTKELSSPVAYKNLQLPEPDYMMLAGAAYAGDVEAQEKMVDFHTLTNNDIIYLLPDKEQATYWFKRAVLGGSGKEVDMKEKISKSNFSYDSTNSKFIELFSFKELQSMMAVAHMYPDLNKIFTKNMCPFAIRGFEAAKGTGQDSLAMGYEWQTHVIKNKNAATQVYNSIYLKFMKEFSANTFPDIKWYVIPDNYFKSFSYPALYSPDLQLANVMADFTVKEKDGQLYKMRMLLIIWDRKSGYQIAVRYMKG